MLDGGIIDNRRFVVNIYLGHAATLLGEVTLHKLLVDNQGLALGLGNATAIVVDDHRIEIGIASNILVYQFVVVHGVVDATELLAQPLEGHIGTADAGQTALGIIDGLDKCGVVATDVGAIVIVVGG